MKIERSIFLSFVFILFISAILVSCGNDESSFENNLSLNEKSLNLVSPNGDKIAKDISTLKDEIKIMLAETVGLDKQVEILGIEYSDVKEGYLAFIKYKTDDGIISTFACSNSSNVNIGTGVVKFSAEKRLKSTIESGTGSTVFICHNNGSCSNCSLQGSYNPSSGTHTITCSCNSCILEIKNR